MENTNYLMIPYSVIQLEGLTPCSKFLLAEIMSLSRIDNNCYASNDYFAKRLSFSKYTIKKSIRELKERGLITSKIVDNNKRTLYPCLSKIYTAPDTKNTLPPSKKYTGGGTKNTHNNNIYNNKYNINYKENKSHSRKSSASYDIEELMKIE